MSEELRECPFCGEAKDLRLVTDTDYPEIECLNCFAVSPFLGDGGWDWNTRPAEDALKAEVEELRYIVEQFKQWYNDNGCPKKHNPDFPCSAEKEYKDDPETGGDFDERDCWKEEYEHGCWVEYYRWKFRQKLDKDTNVGMKGGEDENNIDG